MKNSIKEILLGLSFCSFILACIVAVLLGACYLAEIDKQDTKEQLFSNNVETFNFEPSGRNLGVKESLESALLSKFELAEYGDNGLRIVSKK